MTYKAHNAAEYNGAAKQNTHLPWKTVFRSMLIVSINLKKNYTKGQRKYYKGYPWSRGK